MAMQAQIKVHSTCYYRIHFLCHQTKYVQHEKEMGGKRKNLNKLNIIFNAPCRLPMWCGLLHANLIVDIYMMYSLHYYQNLFLSFFTSVVAVLRPRLRSPMGSCHVVSHFCSSSTQLSVANDCR